MLLVPAIEVGMQFVTPVTCVLQVVAFLLVAAPSLHLSIRAQSTKWVKLTTCTSSQVSVIMISWTNHRVAVIYLPSPCIEI